VQLYLGRSRIFLSPASKNNHNSVTKDAYASFYFKASVSSEKKEVEIIGEMSMGDDSV
jgi:hypothetical protein